ncbi:glycoside hydrolase domain-containing protein [Bradyrhizobium sp. UFLA05-153]
MIIDTNMRTTPRLASLRQSGVDTIIRYYCRNTRQAEKRLTPDEAAAIIRAGLRLAVVYQGAGDSAASFSQDAGAQDGAYARDYAANVIGQPAGSAIYFAVDYDASDADIRTRIVPYFNAVRQALKGGAGDASYQVGVYGSGAVCQALLQAGLVSYTWVSQSGGFNGTAAFLRSGQWNLHQRLPSTLYGLSVDPNDPNPQRPQFGAFNQLATGAPALANIGVASNYAPLPSISATFVQQQLQRLNYPPGAIDGDYGPLTRAALLAFQADNNLPLTGVADAATAAAFETARPRALDPARVRATADDLREMGSVTVKQADHTKTAGWIASILGVLGIGNSGIVEMANSAGAPVTPPPTGQLPQGLFKFLGDLQVFLSSGQPADKLEPIKEGLRQLQAVDLKSLITPENANVLQQLKALIPPDVLTKNPDLSKVLQLADIARQARPQLQTVFDMLPSFFTDGTALQVLAKGAAVAASSMIPGFGGSLAALGIGLAANYFGNKIIQARVADHQTGANRRL